MDTTGASGGNRKTSASAADGECGPGQSAGHQTEGVASRTPVNAPRDHFPGGARPPGDVLAGKGRAGLDDPLVRGGEVANQNVEMNQRACPACGRLALASGDALEREPLAIRRRLQRDPAGIPLHRRPAEQPGPEVRQVPRIKTIKHDLAYPPDNVIIMVHQPMMTRSGRPPVMSAPPCRSRAAGGNGSC
jgi:hypothetical protein